MLKNFLNAILSIFKFNFNKLMLSLNPATVMLFMYAQLGGKDSLLILMGTIMLGDFVTGIGKGIFVEQFDLNKIFIGLFRKAALLYLIVIGVKIDIAFGTSVVRDAFVCFVTGYEGLSMLENYDKLGLPAPKGLSEFMIQLKSSGDIIINTEDNTND